MAYVAPSTRVTGTLITAAIWNQDVVNNVAHIASMLIGGTAISALAAGVGAARMTGGTYTGDGGATKAITGLGFQPKALLVYAKSGTPYGFWIKTNHDTTGSINMSAYYYDDMIISLDADGFTVGDGTPGAGGAPYHCNVNTRVYNYIAWRW